MSQVSKIDEIFNKVGFVEIRDNDHPDLLLGHKIGGKYEAKQAILSAILEVMPVREGGAAVGKNYRSGYAKGNNDALDEWEQAIKELFG